MLKLRYLIFGLAVLFAGIGGSWTQKSPQTPKPITDQQTKESGDSQQKPNEQIKPTEKATTAVPVTPAVQLKEKTARDRANVRDDGTEFWPTFFGYRIKITDSFLPPSHYSSSLLAHGRAVTFAPLSKPSLAANILTFILASSIQIFCFLWEETLSIHWLPEYRSLKSLRHS